MRSWQLVVQEHVDPVLRRHVGRKKALEAKIVALQAEGDHDAYSTLWRVLRGGDVRTRDEAALGTLNRDLNALAVGRLVSVALVQSVDRHLNDSIDLGMLKSALRVTPEMLNISAAPASDDPRDSREKAIGYVSALTAAAAVESSRLAGPTPGRSTAKLDRFRLADVGTSGWLVMQLADGAVAGRAEQVDEALRMMSETLISGGVTQTQREFLRGLIVAGLAMSDGLHSRPRRSSDALQHELAARTTPPKRPVSQLVNEWFPLRPEYQRPARLARREARRDARR